MEQIYFSTAAVHRKNGAGLAASWNSDW